MRTIALMDFHYSVHIPSMSRVAAIHLLLQFLHSRVFYVVLKLACFLVSPQINA